MTALISYEEASGLVIEMGRQQSLTFLKTPELVPLREATGRICAGAVYGHEDVPRFNNSSMDGFAVRAEETMQASPEKPVIFNVQGQVFAGDAPTESPSVVERGCYEIMTGAPLPFGFDGVYKIEDVEVRLDGDGKACEIKVRHALEKFEHFREAGADFQAGQKIFDAGTTLLPEQVMALASVGVSQVSVVRRPRVAILSTGSELAPPDTKDLAVGKIRNSTSSYLLSAMNYFGADVRSYGIVADQREKFMASLSTILADRPDVIITTGAVSKGSHDFIPEVVASLGAETIFHNVAMRPGKPQLFAKFEKGGPSFFGLPGNPISTVVGLRFFVYRYLRALTGQNAERPMRAHLKDPVEKPRGLKCFFKGQVEFSEKGSLISSLNGQASFMVSSLLQANAWLALSEEVEILGAGTSVEFYPIYPLMHQYSEFHEGKTTRKENCC